MAAHDIPAALRVAVSDKVEACYALAEHALSRTFPLPAITFRRSGKNAGTAFLQQNRINFHPVLLKENQAAFFSDVIPHEVSHLLVWQCFGKVRPHGKEWQAMMRDIFGCTPSTTHSFSTQSLGIKGFSYRCACEGTITLSTRRHNTIQRGGKYRCGRCHTVLTPVA
ncbi:SprT family zinc-dependent metalloprotease [Alteromonas sp. CYL-A6]|uniref:SprT family zinc-dependent metalloprotease n=1 Tax=Alteromonas nitratireducens TaxID=3390813 RepID=UPI0034BEDA57